MAVSATNTFAGSNFSASNTVTGIPIGSAFSGRVVVVCYTTEDNTSVSIGGVDGTADNFSFSGINFAAVVLGSGTTATLVSGASSTKTDVLGAWSLSGNPGTAVTDLGIAFFSASGTVLDLATSTAVPAGDALVGLVIDTSGTGITPSWSSGLGDNGSAFNTNASDASFANNSGRDGSADIAATGPVNFTISGTTPGATIALVVGYTPSGGGTVNLEWHRPLSEPVRIKRAVPWQQAATYSPLPVPNTVPSFGWFKELAQPTYAKRKVQPDGNWWGVFTPAAAAPFGWFMELSQPVLRRGLPAHQQQAATYSPLPVPNPVPSFGYFVPLAQPTYAKRKVQPDGTYWSNFTPVPFVAVSNWHVPLSEPVRRRGLPVFEQQAVAWSNFTPPLSFGWFRPLDEPRRFRRGLPVYEQTFAFYVHVPATVYTLTAATGSFTITVNDATLCRDFVNWVPSTIEGETWTAKAVSSNTWTPKAKQDETWTDEDPDPNTGHACN